MSIHSRQSLPTPQRMLEALVRECLVHAAGWPPQRDDQRTYCSPINPAQSQQSLRHTCAAIGEKSHTLRVVQCAL